MTKNQLTFVFTSFLPSTKDDYDYELTTTGSDGAEMKPLMMSNMLNNHAHNSPSVVITSPNSPLQHRSYSGGGGGGGGADIGSPSNNSGSCSGSYAVPTRKLPPMVVVDIEGGNSGGREGVEGDESKDGGLRRRRGEEGESTTEEGEVEEEIAGGGNGGHRKKDPANIDVSLYTTKKNVAQGMLDIALLSANCSQLKYLLFHYERDTTSLVAPSGNASSSSSSSSNGGHFMDGSWFSSMDFYFIVNLVCIGISISLQVIVGILLILNGRHNVYVRRYQRVADSYSNLILVTVFIITIVNIFLSVFISAR